MIRGERCDLDGEAVVCIVGVGEGRPGLLASFVRLSDGQRFLLLAGQGFVEVAS